MGDALSDCFTRLKMRKPWGEGGWGWGPVFISWPRQPRGSPTPLGKINLQKRPPRRLFSNHPVLSTLKGSGIQLPRSSMKGEKMPRE